VIIVHSYHKPDPRRIMKYVEVTKSCWLWKGALNSGGYGVVSFAGKNHIAPRIVYELLEGKIPDGLHIDHLCRNPPCVNPAHLQPVTPRENALRGLTGHHKNQMKGQEHYNSKKTHCPQGHEYTIKNIYYQSGSRACMICRKVRVQKFREELIAR